MQVLVAPLPAHNPTAGPGWMRHWSHSACSEIAGSALTRKKDEQSPQPMNDTKERGVPSFSRSQARRAAERCKASSMLCCSTQDSAETNCAWRAWSQAKSSQKLSTQRVASSIAPGRAEFSDSRGASRANRSFGLQWARQQSKKVLSLVYRTVQHLKIINSEYSHNGIPCRA